MEIDRDQFQDEAKQALSNFPNKEKKLTLRSLKLINYHLHSLLHRNDRMGMIHSIESRFPFLDDDVIKFGINLPSKYKIKPTFRYQDKYNPFNESKHIIRVLGKKYLTRTLSNRPKRGFPVDPLKNTSIKYQLFNDGYLEQILRLSKKEKKKMLNNSSSNIYRLFSIEIFGRIFHLKDSLATLNKIISKNIIN